MQYSEGEFLPATNVTSVEVGLITNLGQRASGEDTFLVEVSPAPVGLDADHAAATICDSYQEGSYYDHQVTQEESVCLWLTVGKCPEKPHLLIRYMQEAAAKALSQLGVGPMIFVSEVAHDDYDSL